VEKRGLIIALQAAALSQKDRIWHCDEMRFGLWGQVRKRWGLRGFRIIQKVQIEFAWEYLVLAINVATSELKWAWSARMNQEHLMPIFADWQPDVVIWDGASAHRGKEMGKLNFIRIALPSYSPELNPAERVFEHIRGKIEGEVYPSLSAKRHAIEQILRYLNANKQQLKQLIGWQWIQDNFQKLPDESTRCI